MILLQSILAAIPLHATLASPNLQSRQDGLETFIAREQPIALAGALANIGGLNSSWVQGASPGIVVASPSTVNPDYFFTWTRDSALTYTMLIDELIFGNTSLRKTIEDYATAQAILQTIDNPSGSLWPVGDGLGEPKFYTNITPFDGPWGRPQRDGPALRATTFMNLAPVLFNLNETDIFLKIYWPLILNDLNYVGQYWNQASSYPLLTHNYFVPLSTLRISSRPASIYGKKSAALHSSPYQLNIGHSLRAQYLPKNSTRHVAHASKRLKYCVSCKVISGMSRASTWLPTLTSTNCHVAVSTATQSWRVYMSLMLMRHVTLEVCSLLHPILFNVVSSY